MCGRYTLSTPADQIAEILAAELALDAPEPRYNIAPTQPAPIVRGGESGREMVAARWGLVPWWARELSIGNRLINARSETVAGRRAFSDAFQHRRCLVPADGFYEWTRGAGGRRQPHLLRAAAGGPLVFAGLWDRWASSDGRKIDSFTILTRPANDRVAAIHDRMPVLLDVVARDRWLELDGDPRAVLDSTIPTELEIFPVSTRVNSPANDSPLCVEPLNEPEADDQPTLW